MRKHKCLVIYKDTILCVDIGFPATIDLGISNFKTDFTPSGRTFVSCDVISCSVDNGLVFRGAFFNDYGRLYYEDYKSLEE